MGAQCCSCLIIRKRNILQHYFYISVKYRATKEIFYYKLIIPPIFYTNTFSYRRNLRLLTNSYTIKEAVATIYTELVILTQVNINSPVKIYVQK